MNVEKHSSETHTSPDGVTVEVGTFRHEGREFTALGAVVNMGEGRISAYVTARDGSFILTTWGGEEIAPVRLVRSWVQRGFGTIWAWSATVDGRTFSGRNGGPEMLVHMRTRPTSE